MRKSGKNVTHLNPYLSNSLTDSSVTVITFSPINSGLRRLRSWTRIGVDNFCITVNVRRTNHGES